MKFHCRQNYCHYYGGIDGHLGRDGDVRAVLGGGRPVPPPHQEKDATHQLHRLILASGNENVKYPMCNKRF